jgi:RNA polymerase-binding transcription factor DksA
MMLKTRCRRCGEPIDLTWDRITGGGWKYCDRCRQFFPKRNEGSRPCPS